MSGAAKNVGPVMLKKMVTKAILGKSPSVKMIPEGKDSLDLVVVTGIARDVKKGESNFGPWTCFVGDFGAVNMETGEEFRSTRCFLPSVMEEPLVNALAESKNPVQFASIIGIKRNAREPEVKYDYTVKALEKPKESDQLTELMSRHFSHAKQLPAAEPSKGAETGKKK